MIDEAELQDAETQIFDQVELIKAETNEDAKKTEKKKLKEIESAKACMKQRVKILNVAVDEVSKMSLTSSTSARLTKMIDSIKKNSSDKNLFPEYHFSY